MCDVAATSGKLSVSVQFKIEVADIHVGMCVI